MGLAERAARSAERVGKEVVVAVDVDPSLRVPPGPLDGLWSAWVHVVRNAVAHGIEEDRVGAGKAPTGQITLRARRCDASEALRPAAVRMGDAPRGAVLRVEVEDDGQGVAWDRIAAKAAERGWPTATREDLFRAMLADGVSTADAVTELAGRGVGVSAVVEAVRQLGGLLELETEPGRGTVFAAIVPLDAAAASHAA